MKKLSVTPIFVVCLLVSGFGHAKLNDQQTMKCISLDKKTRSALLDLEQAYEMRSVSAKDFFQAFDKSNTCPELRKNLKKLHGDMISRLPVPPVRTPEPTVPFSSEEPELPLIE